MGLSPSKPASSREIAISKGNHQHRNAPEQHPQLWCDHDAIQALFNLCHVKDLCLVCLMSRFRATQAHLQFVPRIQQRILFKIPNIRLLQPIRPRKIPLLQQPRHQQLDLAGREMPPRARLAPVPKSHHVVRVHLDAPVPHRIPTLAAPQLVVPQPVEDVGVPQRRLGLVRVPVAREGDPRPGGDERAVLQDDVAHGLTLRDGQDGRGVAERLGQEAVHLFQRVQPRLDVDARRPRPAVRGGDGGDLVPQDGKVLGVGAQVEEEVDGRRGGGVVARQSQHALPLARLVHVVRPAVVEHVIQQAVVGWRLAAPPGFDAGRHQLGTVAHPLERPVARG